MSESIQLNHSLLTNQLVRRDIDRFRSYKELLDFYQVGTWRAASEEARNG